METPPKSSFMRNQTSKEDAIIQFLRPVLNSRIQQTLDNMERMVTEAEKLTKLGTSFRTRGGNLFATVDDLKANLDEFKELEQFAKEGRALLNSLGYVSPRNEAPILAGAAPVGETVDVQPITMAHPGSEPVSGVIVSPKKSTKKA